MTSSSMPKAPCATCGNKNVGIFKCEGCAQVFCRTHVIEHRDVLTHQLDEIALEYDILQHTIVEHKHEQNQYFLLSEQINKWERDSIEKIQQTAEEARQQIITLGSSHKETISKEMQDLAERLRSARAADDYVETDLRIWTTKIEKMKRDIMTVAPLISVTEDPTNVLIAKIYVAPTQQPLQLTEQFGAFFGNVRIEENAHVAVHDETNVGGAYVCGISEYLKDKHKIRFIIHKKTTMFTMSFDIISKSAVISDLWCGNHCFSYGWCTDDGTNNPDTASKIGEYFRDLRGETTLELELLIDCDNRKISYFNESTKNTRKMNIDIKKCPFPWQLRFFLYDTSDRVQLISSTQVF